jgi:Leucine-rich repeat (LRR) protein
MADQDIIAFLERTWGISLKSRCGYVNGVLTRLSLAHLSLERLPSVVGKLENLEELILDHNRLTDLPAELWQLPNLRWFKIRLERCPRSSSPFSLANAWTR